jgi:hypothetical protein
MYEGSVKVSEAIDVCPSVAQVRARPSTHPLCLREVHLLSAKGTFGARSSVMISALGPVTSACPGWVNAIQI